MLNFIAIVIALFLILLKLWCKLTTGRCLSKRLMKGKTVIITGANSGVGKATALKLAGRGARIIMACRNRKLGLKAAEEVKLLSGNREVFFKYLDVANQSSIRHFAQEIYKEESRLDVLINNAGMAGSKGQLTEDEIEVTFAVNYFGPFLLTCLLLDKLKSSAPSRIIHVSSIMHRFGSVMIDDAANEFCYNPRSAYRNSKLALNIFSKSLAERLVGTGVTSNCLHPGAVNTDIFRYLPKVINYIFRSFLWLFCKTPEEGAETTIYLAVSEEVEKITGKYFSDCKLATENPLSYDKPLADKLWCMSENITQLSQ